MNTNIYTNTIYGNGLGICVPGIGYFPGDAVLIDTDGNGILDTAAYDTDFDGVADTIEYDYNEDGFVDATIFA